MIYCQVHPLTHKFPVLTKSLSTQTMKHHILHAALLPSRAEGALPVLAEGSPHGNSHQVFVSGFPKMLRTSLYCPPKVHLCLSSGQPGSASEPHKALLLMTDFSLFSLSSSQCPFSADAVQSKHSGVPLIKHECLQSRLLALLLHTLRFITLSLSLTHTHQSQIAFPCQAVAYRRRKAERWWV